MPARPAKTPATVTFQNPWERRHGESASAYRAFQVYLHLGPSRTLDDASIAYRAANESGVKSGSKVGQEPPRKRPLSSRISEWSRQFAWTERATAYDRHLDHVESEERRRLDEERRVSWVQKDEKRLEQNWSIAAQLKIKALQMLGWSLDGEVRTVKVLNDDGSVTEQKVVVAPAWRMRDAATLLGMANLLEQTVIGAIAGKQSEAPTAAEQITDESLEGAEKRLFEWRKKVRNRINEIREDSPYDPGDGPGKPVEPLPDH